MLRYRLRRPRPPRHPVPFAGPVLVVGSAPVSQLPRGFGSHFSVVTINGSQSVTRAWGLGPPDVTFLQYGHVDQAGPNAVAVRGLLKGECTRLLYVVLWRRGLSALRRGLAAFDYRAEALRTLSRQQRMALHAAALGRVNPEIDNDMKFSNGITAVLYALVNRAPAVVITGIDPGSQGHVYNDLGLRRLHADTDRDTLVTLRARGFPVYSADPHVATALGLPLWDGQDPD